MKQYCLKDVQWFIDNNEKVVVPFIFNNGCTKIKLLENEQIIPLGLEQGHRTAWWLTDLIASRKIAEYKNIKLEKEYETVFNSTDFLFTKLYKTCFNPKDCEILKELPELLKNSKSLEERSIIDKFVQLKLATYNDLYSLIYTYLDLDNHDIVNLTHNQTTNF